MSVCAGKAWSTQMQLEPGQLFTEEEEIVTTSTTLNPHYMQIRASETGQSSEETYKLFSTAITSAMPSATALTFSSGNLLSGRLGYPP